MALSHAKGTFDACSIVTIFKNKISFTDAKDSSSEQYKIVGYTRA